MVEFILGMFLARWAMNSLLLGIASNETALKQLCALAIFGGILLYALPSTRKVATFAWLLPVVAYVGVSVVVTYSEALTFVVGVISGTVVMALSKVLIHRSIARSEMAKQWHPAVKALLYIV